MNLAPKDTLKGQEYQCEMAIDEEEQITKLEATIRTLPEGKVRRGMEEALKKITGSDESRTDGQMEIIFFLPGIPNMMVCLSRTATINDLRDAAAKELGVEPGASFRFLGLPHEAAMPLVDLGVESGSRVGINIHPALLRVEKAHLRHPHERPFEKFALALHCCCIEAGFVCKTKVDTPKETDLLGFAPAVRKQDLSNDGLAPVGWNSAPGVAWHPNFPGVTYELEVVLSYGEVTSKFRHGSGTGGSASTTAASFSVNEDRLKSLDAFEEALHQFETSTLADFDRYFSTSPPNSVHPTPASSSIPFPTGHFEPPRAVLPGASGDFAGDLGPGVGLGPVVGQGQGGNLMGPDHPMFGEGRVGYLPEARFDPYGPPMRGMPPRPQGPGRPRSSGRQPFAEPNPDHFQPPGNDDMFL